MNYIRSFIGICLLIMMRFSFAIAPGDGFTRGEITHTVICEADSTQSYSLFLPSYYVEDEPWPVIFLFDPAGNGLRALELFKPSAEEFGYILAASNTTENGPWDSFLTGANAMFRDVEARFSIDPYRRYTSGFSGAAEAASGLAVLYDGIIGVIGCGAGFSPNYAPHFDIDFHYLGLIGDRDAHYQEMQNLDLLLKRYNVDHYIMTFAGGHDWPQEGLIREALLWLQFKAMKHDIIAIDDGMVVKFYQEHIQLIDSLEGSGEIPQAYAMAQKVLTYLDGLKRMNDLVKRKDDLYKSPAYARFKADQERISIREKVLTDTYLEAFDVYKMSFADGMTPAQPVKWWEKQVRAAQDMANSAKNPLDQLLGLRIIDFIWRTAYAYYKSVDGTEFYPVAINYLDIWKAAQPDGISPYFFSAVYYTRFNRYDKAIGNIRLAVRNGLEDPWVLENDPDLQHLGAEPGFKAILQDLWALQELKQEQN